MKNRSEISYQLSLLKRMCLFSFLFMFLNFSIVNFYSTNFSDSFIELLEEEDISEETNGIEESFEVQPVEFCFSEIPFQLPLKNYLVSINLNIIFLKEVFTPPPELMF